MCVWLLIYIFVLKLLVFRWNFGFLSSFVVEKGRRKICIYDSILLDFTGYAALITEEEKMKFMKLGSKQDTFQDQGKGVRYVKWFYYYDFLVLFWNALWSTWKNSTVLTFFFSSMPLSSLTSQPQQERIQYIFNKLSVEQ